MTAPRPTEKESPIVATSTMAVESPVGELGNAKNRVVVTSSTRRKATTPPLVSLSPMENLAVGAVGGALETCLQMPILTYKFCIQEGRALPTSLGGWYRGVGVQAGTVAPITALQFLANGMLQNGIKSVKKTSTLSNMDQVCAAAGAGMMSAVAYSPVDLITIQQQKLQLNPFQTARHIIHEYGLFGTRGFYRGFVSCAGREAVYTAGYLGLAPLLTTQLVPKLMGLEEENAAASQSLSVRLTGACLAGTLAAVITHPLDTAKTCVQSDLSRTQWITARQSMTTLVNTHGIASLYRGMIPRTVRLCGAFFVCLLVRDAAIAYKTTTCQQEEE